MPRTPLASDTDPALPARRQWLQRAGLATLAAGLLASGGWALARHGRQLWRVSRERTLMATSVAITCFAPDAEMAARAIEAAYARMDRVAAELTRFDPAGPLARLNRDGTLAVVPNELAKVLGTALALAAHSEGAFDPTVLPALLELERLRGHAHANEDPQALARARALTDWRALTLDARGARLARPGMAVTLDGIAKGHVVDQGIAALRAHGIEDALIDAGGDVHAISGAASRRRWHVGIVDPRDPSRLAAVLEVRNGAVSTSGNYRVFFTADRHAFHLVNPRTARSPDTYASVTVLARHSIHADGLSTAAFPLALPALDALLADGDHAWLAFPADGAPARRSRELPLIRGEARPA